MKALSIKQPWAWAIIHGGKPVENRDWRYPPKYRGPLFIHASKTFDWDGFEWITLNIKKLGLSPQDVPQYEKFYRGGLIGIVNMVDVVTEHPSPWFFGPLGFVLEDPRPLEFFRCNGQLGIFDLPVRKNCLHCLGVMCDLFSTQCTGDPYCEEYVNDGL